MDLLPFRGAVTLFALIYAIWLLGDSRKFLRHPWPFLFILVRLVFTVFLRGAMVLHFPIGEETSEIILTLVAILDLMSLVAIHRNFPRLPE